jgi:hypothetical protein
MDLPVVHVVTESSAEHTAGSQGAKGGSQSGFSVAIEPPFEPSATSLVIPSVGTGRATKTMGQCQGEVWVLVVDTGGVLRSISLGASQYHPVSLIHRVDARRTRAQGHHCGTTRRVDGAWLL